MDRLLMVLRHGKSRRDLPLPDRERPLAERGRLDVPRVARYAVAKGFLPELILCSPAARARETAKLFREETGDGAEFVRMQDLYLASEEEVFSCLGSAPADIARVMVVGHNPGLEDLCFRLAGTDFPHDHLPTGGLAVFSVAPADDWEAISPATTRLLELVRPKGLPRDR